MSWMEESYKTESLEELRDRLDSAADKEIVDKAISDITKLSTYLTSIRESNKKLAEMVEKYKQFLEEDEED